MILLDLKDSRPIYEQVVERFQELMMMGILEEDSQMPSVRSLAMELSINPNTIQRAYGELERRGYTYSVKGRGSFVGSIRKLREAKKTELERKLEKLAREAKTIGIQREEFVMAAGRMYDSGPAGRKEPEDRKQDGTAQTGSKGRGDFGPSERDREESITRTEQECQKEAMSQSQKAEDISGERLWVGNEQGGMTV